MDEEAAPVRASQPDTDAMQPRRIAALDAWCSDALGLKLPVELLRLIVADFARHTFGLWDPDRCLNCAPKRGDLATLEFPVPARRLTHPTYAADPRSRTQAALGMHEFAAGKAYLIQMRLACGRLQHAFTTVGVVPASFDFAQTSAAAPAASRGGRVEKPFVWRDFSGQNCTITLDFSRRTMRAHGGKGTVRVVFWVDVPGETYFRWEAPVERVAPPVKLYTTWSSGGGSVRVTEAFETTTESHAARVHAALGGGGGGGGGGAVTPSLSVLDGVTQSPGVQVLAACFGASVLGGVVAANLSFPFASS